jgi:hypothetical protein
LPTAMIPPSVFWLLYSEFRIPHSASTSEVLFFAHRDCSDPRILIDDVAARQQSEIVHLAVSLRSTGIILP